MSSGKSNIRVAVLGNSNSVMRSSYVRHLAKIPGISIDNFSVGATPNAYLFYGYDHVKEQEYDYIIIETSVTDSEWARLDLYGLDLCHRNLKIFGMLLRKISSSKIIVLILPTVSELEDDTFSTETMYEQFALHNGFNVVNMYAIYRTLMAKSKLSELYFFEDMLHISPPTHNLVAEILIDIIKRGPSDALAMPRRADEIEIYSAVPLNEADIEQKTWATSLLSARCFILHPGQSIKYHFDRPVYLSSICVNRQNTSCIICVRYDSKVIFKDLRLVHEIGNFIFHIVPFQSILRGCDFEITLAAAEAIGDNAVEVSSHINASVNLERLEISTASFVEAPEFDPAPALEPGGLDHGRELGGETSALGGDLDAYLQTARDHALLAMMGSRAMVAAQANWFKPLLRSLSPLQRRDALHAMARLLFFAGELDASLEFETEAVSLREGGQEASPLQRTISRRHAVFHELMTEWVAGRDGA